MRINTRSFCIPEASLLKQDVDIESLAKNKILKELSNKLTDILLDSEQNENAKFVISNVMVNKTTNHFNDTVEFVGSFEYEKEIQPVPIMWDYPIDPNYNNTPSPDTLTATRPDRPISMAIPTMPVMRRNRQSDTSDALAYALNIDNGLSRAIRDVDMATRHNRSRGGDSNGESQN